LTKIFAILPSEKIGCDDVFVSHSILNPIFSEDWSIDLISEKFVSLCALIPANEYLL